MDCLTSLPGTAAAGPSGFVSVWLFSGGFSGLVFRASGSRSFAANFMPHRPFLMAARLAGRCG